MFYAVLTDIHANYQALTAVSKDVKQLRAQRNVPIQYWFLGDLIGYGPDPVSCIRWLKLEANIGRRWVPGNHDEWLVDPSNVSGDARASLTRNRETLSQRDNLRWRDWFAEEVRQAITEEARSLVVEELEELTAVFVHASVSPSLRRRTNLFPWLQQIVETEFLALSKEVNGQADTTVLFAGHTHFPMWATQIKSGVDLRSIAYERSLPLPTGISLINPGSVGQPRDSDVRAAYAILDTEVKTIEFRRVEYDVAATAAELRENGYPESLAKRLETGDGRAELQHFNTVYKKPEWDLQAINHKRN